MNVRGRDILMGAAIEGIRQLRGEPADGRGAYSATGLLLQSAACPHLLMAKEKYALPEQQAAHERCLRKVRRRFCLSEEDLAGLQHLNDSVGTDFLTIAWALTRPAITTADIGEDDDAVSPQVDDVPACPATDSSSARPAGSNRPQDDPKTAQLASQGARGRGYLKFCRSCGRQIYLHQDTDGVWRPYESWIVGNAAEGEWRPHDC